jgi:Protein of unknown function (DUF1353)
VGQVTEHQTVAPRDERELGFEKGSVVDVEEAADAQDPDLQDPKFWTVRKEITYHARSRDFVVRVGKRTDFASVPRMFVWLLPRYGRYTKAAILHDHLWGEEVPRHITRLEADGIFRQAMRELKVPFLRRWLIWAAVRWGALVKPDGREGWMKEAPRVLLVTILAAPLLFPPSIIVLAALLIFWGIEWIVYLPLRLIEKAKQRPGKPTPKRANPPEFPWNTA